MEYFKDRYNEAKDYNRSKIGGERKISRFYDEIDFIFGCCDIVIFSCIEEFALGFFSSFFYLNGKEGGLEEEGSVNDE